MYVFCFLLQYEVYTHVQNCGMFCTATLPTVSRQHTIELLPNATHACMVFNITVEQELVFSVISNEDSIEVINPNGTIVGEVCGSNTLLSITT